MLAIDSFLKQMRLCLLKNNIRNLYADAVDREIDVSEAIIFGELKQKPLEDI